MQQQASCCAILIAMLACGSANAEILTPLRELHRSGFTTAIDWPSVSPDESQQGLFGYGELSFMSVNGVAPSAKVQGLPKDDTLIKFGGDGPVAIRWTADSRALWSATWPWPNGVMKPVRIAIDGSIEQGKDPAPSTAPLDGILFVNGDGLAIATYGTSPLSNSDSKSHPSLALVDFKAGSSKAVLQLDQPVKSLEGGFETLARPFMQDAVSQEVTPGHIRFIGVVGSRYQKQWWLVWDTESGATVFPRLRGWPLDRAALSPDGTKLLSARNLQGTAPGGYDVPRCPTPSKPDPTPSVVLYDLATGKPIWERHEPDAYYILPARPVFSPDGRFAFVALPAGSKKAEGRLGLISLRDGRVLAETPTEFYGMNLQLLDGGATLAVQTLDELQLFHVDWQAVAEKEASSDTPQAAQVQ